MAAETTSVYFTASAPCIEGSMAGGARGAGDVHSHSLSVHRDAWDDSAWRAALQRLFTGFAAETDAVFASAEVVRGIEWSGRAMTFGASAERTTYLAGGGQWAGLPPYPVWWSWFGREYTPLVLDHLPADQVVRVGAATFHARGEAPLDRTQLTRAFSGSPPERHRRGIVRHWFSRQAVAAPARTWLPAGLLPVVDDSDPRLHNPPLTPAATVPAGIRTDG